MDYIYIGSYLQIMDVYDTFYAYKKNGSIPSLRGQKDAHIKGLVRLMKRQETSASKFALHHIDAHPFCDHFFYNKSSHKIDALAKHLGARVSMEWVKACASKVDPPNSMQLEMLDETSDRHIHVVEPSISIFLKLLQTNPQTTITFSRTPAARYAIHLPILYKQLKKICTNKPVLWLMIACSIGIPTHGLYTPQKFLCKWKKEPNRKILNNDNVILSILRPIIRTNGIKETEITQLVHNFQNMETDFKNTDPVITIDDYMFKRIYTYPTAREIQHLVDRVQKNINYITPTLQLASPKNKRSETEQRQTRTMTRNGDETKRAEPSHRHAPRSPAKHKKSQIAGKNTLMIL